MMVYDAGREWLAIRISHNLSSHERVINFGQYISIIPCDIFATVPAVLSLQKKDQPTDGTEIFVQISYKISDLINLNGEIRSITKLVHLSKRQGVQYSWN